ncbi:metallophosphoesterase [Chitinophaga sp. CC14]|uniref:metallophosphoesterase n=1 Tax=Chitinophaga sp. CC14 TaxID=3029199 RepID=UPI003B7A82CD
MNGFKKVYLALRSSFLFIPAVNAQDTALLNDGPYLFYENGKPVVKAIIDNQITRLENPKEVQVSFKDHADWNFTVPIQSRLENEPADFKLNIEKLFILSDIEGEFETFRKILIANKVIDEKYNWTFGKGRLVIDGDLFDRGNNVPETLWLLYKLEQEAKKQGGYVHTLLGNHEIMNLSGDLRYVEPKYLESAKLLGISYMRLYDHNTELGRWLRTKNIIERIGGKLFLHAGMSPEVYKHKLSVETINSKCRPYYASSKKDLPDSMKVFFGKDSPFWYRGYFLPPRTTTAELEKILRFYNCTLIIVGHTILKRNVAFYYGGKVLDVDTDQHAGKGAGALFTNAKWFAIDATGKRKRLHYKRKNDEIKEEDIL